MRGKLLPMHLQRKAYVYVRQSTVTQVRNHKESQKRQYALADQAIAMGWSAEAVEVIDEDQGRSGTHVEGRHGFARLAHDVAHGKVGAIFAIEASRLSRSSEDWQRLLSICAVAQVLLIDEQTIYDPGDEDDKLILNVKGVMSEQEIRWLILRLAGNRLNKARRGESYIHPPVGYIWAGSGLALDPDESVRHAVAVILERFDVEPSARAVVKWTQRTNFLMPTRHRSTGEVVWGQLGGGRFLDMLHNPAYAGVYAFGRRPVKKVLIDGEIRQVRQRLDNPSDWPVRIDNAHPSYISWERYMKNKEKLSQNQFKRRDGTQGAPREGLALLTGLLLCGRCGRRMSPHYEDHKRSPTGRWLYTCYGESSKGKGLCWSVSGTAIDRAVEQLFLETVVPSEVELSLAVATEVGRQSEALARSWKSRIEQVRYEARLAERRYKAVDPDNRVVARTLEAEWEQRLCDVEAVEQQYAEARRLGHVELSDGDRQRIRELSRDLAIVWRSPTTGDADRKAMLRVVIEVIRVDPIEVPRRATRIQVQWHSGAVSELEIARFGKGDKHRHSPEAIKRLGELVSTGYHDDDVAEQLNLEGLRTGTGLEWNGERVLLTRRNYGIQRVAKDRQRMPPLPEQDPQGRYSVPGAEARFGISRGKLYRWIQAGLVSAIRADYGTHRDVYWIQLDEAKVSELQARNCRPSK
jgi:DNA invertase Pin-like site-specific DNA recombinase